MKYIDVGFKVRVAWAVIYQVAFLFAALAISINDRIAFFLTQSIVITLKFYVFAKLTARRTFLLFTTAPPNFARPFTEMHATRPVEI